MILALHDDATSSGGGTDRTKYAYDPFGRRLRKTTAAGTTWYLWDGDQLLAEYEETSPTTSDRKVRYAYAGGFVPAQVAYDDGAGGESVYHVHADHLDTPRMLTDGSGNAVWRGFYEAFGSAHVDSGSTLTEEFNIRFPGQYFDAETGLHYNRFRYYDPSVGRYVSADPIGQFGATAGIFSTQLPQALDLSGGVDANSYAYSLANPTNLVDPSGLITLQDAANFAAGFGDALTFGLTSALNDLTGASSVVDPCSGAFSAGQFSGLGLGVAFGAAGAVKAAGGIARVGAGSVDDLLKGAAKGRSGKSQQFTKSGDLDDANRAFDRFARGSKVTDHGGGVRSTTLSDGTTASVRQSSSGGQPTIQVNPGGGGKPIKIRFQK